MRTTLTLDDDVAEAVKAEARRGERPFKDVVNELLRTALYLRRKRRAIPQFVVRARPLGVRSGLNYDRIADLMEDLEGPAYR